MSESIFEYSEEFKIMDIVREYAERVSHVIDEQALANAEHKLAEYGYAKVVRCSDCKYFATRNGLGLCKRWSYFSIRSQPDDFCSRAEMV